MNGRAVAGKTPAIYNNQPYYMAVSQGLGTTNSRIWLAEMDIDRGLDFAI